MVCPYISCPVCGLRLTPSRLTRLNEIDVIPIVGMRGAGRGRGWVVAYRIYDWERVADLVGLDLIWFWSVRMLSVLRSWLDAGLLPAEVVSEFLGLRRVLVRPSWLAPERSEFKGRWAVSKRVALWEDAYGGGS